MRRVRRRRRLRFVLSAIGVLLVSSLLLVGVLVLSGGWQIRPILSGSMKPGFSVGGVAITQRVPIGELKLREVAVFHPPSQPQVDYIHRIISLKRSATGLVIQTAGDNNTSPDPWTLYASGKYAYVVRFTLPLVGYAAIWVHSPGGREVILIGAGLLALTLLISAFWDRRKLDTTTSSPDHPSPKDASNANSEVFQTQLDDADSEPVTAGLTTEATPPQQG